MFFFKKIKQLKERNKELEEEILRLSTQSYIIWKISRFTDEDKKLLWQNKDILKTFKKYIEFKIALKIDTTRNLKDWISIDEKAWYLNCLYELIVFLDNLLLVKESKDKYTWQDLK